jgi:hypothetical protein
MSRDIVSILLSVDNTSTVASTGNFIDIKTFLTFFSGGAFGTLMMIIYNKIRGRIQTMECHYIDDDVISRLPIQIEGGDSHQNIFSKHFLLKNTTNTDIKDFVTIFEFDCEAKIIRHTDVTKAGVDRLKKKLLKPNEYSVTIKNFNRKDEVKFIFEIANVTKDYCNVTEDNCIGFKIKLKDKRKAMIKSKLKLVDKATLNQAGNR